MSRWHNPPIPLLTGLLTLGLILPLLAAATDLQLKPFQALFQVSRNDLPLGTMDIRLTLDDQESYAYTGHTKPGGIVGLIISDEVHEASRGSYKNNRIRPNRYEYLQDNGERKKQTQLDFDWPDGQVWTDSEGQRWAQPMTADTQDKYSQQLALRLDLAKGVREVSYPVADGGRDKDLSLPGRRGRYHQPTLRQIEMHPGQAQQGIRSARLHHLDRTGTGLSAGQDRTPAVLRQLRH